MATVKPHAYLGLKPGCGSAAVKARYRSLASEHHPDKGGNADTFAAVSKAYEEALAIETQTEKVCKTCEGRGHVMLGKSTNPFKMRCSQCNGTGERKVG